jgi:hypothetical protein
MTFGIQTPYGSLTTHMTRDLRQASPQFCRTPILAYDGTRRLLAASSWLQYAETLKTGLRPGDVGRPDMA